MYYDTKNTFLIVNKKVQYALQTSEQGIQKVNDVQVGPLNPNNKRQLWIFQLNEDNSYQIVNGFTDNVLTADGSKVILKRGSAGRHQLWKIQFLNEKEFRIRKAKSKSDYLVLEKGVVRVRDIQVHVADIWTFQLVSQSVSLSKTCFIRSKETNKVIDIPEASFEEGTTLGVWDINYRYNQRWRILRAGQIYVIKSHFNQLNLDVEDQKYENGADIVQWSSHGGVNQFWMFERVQPGKKQFRISTCFDRQYQLAHHHGKLVLHQGRTYKWVVDGYFPE